MESMNAHRKRIRRILKEYNLLKAQIECIEIVLKNEKDKQRIDRLIELRKYNKSLIDPIDISIEDMDFKYQQILKLKYLNRNTMTWNEVGRALGYSTEYCRKDLFDKCLRKIIINADIVR